MLTDTSEVQTQEMARFGHTITTINDTSLFVFGGAIETSRGIYSTTSDSYIINRETLVWS